MLFFLHMSLFLVLCEKLIFCFAPIVFSSQIICCTNLKPVLHLDAAVTYGWLSSTLLSILDRVQRKPIRLIDDYSLTWSGKCLRYLFPVFTFFSFSELASVVPLPATLTRDSRIQVASYSNQVSVCRFHTLFFQSFSSGLLNCENLSLILYSHPPTIFCFSISGATKWFLRECQY